MTNTMRVDAVLESYVGDVVRRLPRRQRRDVAAELHSLLAEELAGRAADSGREADSAMLLDLLGGFGRPDEVADRYRPAGFTIIRPSDAPRFALVSFVGVAVQWVLSLTATFATPSDVEPLSLLGAWWLSWGLGSFWWPGFLVSASIVAAVIGARREPSVWTPRLSTLDRDRVSRLGTVVGLALGVLGISLLIALVSLGSIAPGLPEPVLAAFTFDEGFLAWRAPWVLLLWAATYAIMIAVLIAGRWTRRTRVLSLVSNLLWLALLALWVLGGPIFVQAAADSTTKGALLLVAVFVVVDAIGSVRRLVPRARPGIA